MQDIRKVTVKVPQAYLDFINQIFEIEKKANNLKEENFKQRCMSPAHLYQTWNCAIMPQSFKTPSLSKDIHKTLVSVRSCANKEPALACSQIKCHMTS